VIDGVRPSRSQHLADLGRTGDVDRRRARAVDGDDVVAATA
jgi:hypothetical protein